MTFQEFFYEVHPIAKVRQTKSDQWKKRPCVVRYRAYADWLREHNCSLEAGDEVHFLIAMPKSWNARKREKLWGTYHEQKPDIDNLLGGLMDSVHPDSDCKLSYFGALSKRWWDTSGILIRRPTSLVDPLKIPLPSIF